MPQHDVHIRIPDSLGYYLAGLTDGEGCFSISPGRVAAYSCAFIVHMRADDRPLLEWLREETGLGGICTGRRTQVGGDQPSVRWTVSRRCDCLALVAIFERYPLRSKKARDFDLWARAVHAWVALDFGQMAELHVGLRAARVFESAGDDWYLVEPVPQLELFGEAVA